MPADAEVAYDEPSLDGDMEVVLEVDVVMVFDVDGLGEVTVGKVVRMAVDDVIEDEFGSEEISG